MPRNKVADIQHKYEISYFLLLTPYPSLPFLSLAQGRASAVICRPVLIGFDYHTHLSFHDMFARSVLRQGARVAARSYATQASTKPPVQLFGLEGSYASALYSASAKASSVDATEKSLNTLKDLLAQDKDLTKILSNPALSSKDKKTVVETISSAASADKTVSNFLTLLADNNRLSILPDVIDKFGILANAYHGFVDASVTSATQLDKSTLDRLQKAISKSEYAEGKKLRVKNIVNPDIMGGLVVEVGNNTLDLSVSSRLTKLNKLLTDSV